MSCGLETPIQRGWQAQTACIPPDACAGPFPPFPCPPHNPAQSGQLQCMPRIEHVWVWGQAFNAKGVRLARNCREVRASKCAWCAQTAQEANVPSLKKCGSCQVRMYAEWFKRLAFAGMDCLCCGAKGRDHASRFRSGLMVPRACLQAATPERDLLCSYVRHVGPCCNQIKCSSCVA